MSMDYTALREAALRARQNELEEPGFGEWFAASPDVILRLLDERDRLEVALKDALVALSDSEDQRPGTAMLELGALRHRIRAALEPKP